MVLWVDFALVTLILYLLTFLPTRWIKVWYPRCFQSWCWIFLRALGVELTLQQKNLKPLPQHYILMGNHPSILEDLGMPALFKARFLAKRELKDWWIVGRMSVATGTLYVKRDVPESRREAKEMLTKVVLGGENIALYPEGGCHGRRIHLPFHRGGFAIALATGVPIVPVFLHYEAQEDFEWKNHETVFEKLLAIRKAQNKKVNYYVFDAIDPKLFSSKEALCEHVQNLYLTWQAKYLE